MNHTQENKNRVVIGSEIISGKGNLISTFGMNIDRFFLEFDKEMCIHNIISIRQGAKIVLKESDELLKFISAIDF